MRGYRQTGFVLCFFVTLSYLLFFYQPPGLADRSETAESGQRPIAAHVQSRRSAATNLSSERGSSGPANGGPIIFTGPMYNRPPRIQQMPQIGQQHVESKIDASLNSAPNPAQLNQVQFPGNNIGGIVAGANSPLQKNSNNVALPKELEENIRRRHMALNVGQGENQRKQDGELEQMRQKQLQIHQQQWRPQANAAQLASQQQPQQGQQQQFASRQQPQQGQQQPQQGQQQQQFAQQFESNQQFSGQQDFQNIQRNTQQQQPALTQQRQNVPAQQFSPGQQIQFGQQYQQGQVEQLQQKSVPPAQPFAPGQQLQNSQPNQQGKIELQQQRPVPPAQPFAPDQQLQNNQQNQLGRDEQLQQRRDPLAQQTFPQQQQNIPPNLSQQLPAASQINALPQSATDTFVVQNGTTA
uniref:Uncharacterized protein n=1 Tax=Plectus sambesii TaxID=2011161 RepID=A0A914VM34_9BILA